MSANIAHEVDAAALPGGTKHFGNGALDTEAGVRVSTGVEKGL